MSDEVQRALGTLTAQIEALVQDRDQLRSRVTRLESGVVGALLGGTYLYLKSQGLV